MAQQTLTPPDTDFDHLRTGLSLHDGESAKSLIGKLNSMFGEVYNDLSPQPAPQTATNTATLTAAQILGRILVGTPTAAAAYTLPLGTSLETSLLALYPNLAVDDSFDLAVINAAVVDTRAITMTTNTGWTLVGNMVVQENENASHLSSAIFRIRRTAANTYILYRIG